MVCPKCGKTNEDNRVYCYKCNEMLTPSAGKSDDFNQSKRRKKIQRAELAEKRSGAIKANKKSKVRPGRIALFSVIFAALIVGGVFAVKKLTEVNISKLPVYYIKDEMLMAMNYADGREYIISEMPAIDRSNYDGTGVKEGAFQFTSDYKYCYFLQSGDDANGYTLCKFKVGVTDLNKEDETLIEIDKNVIDFKFSDNGKKVVYKKVGVTEGVGKLYYFDGKESQLVAGDVYDYCMDSDFSIVYYTKHTDGQVVSLYEAKLKKPEKANKVCDDIVVSEEIRQFGDSVVYVAQQGREQHLYLKGYGEDAIELGKGKMIKIEKVCQEAVYYSEVIETSFKTEDVIEDTYFDSDQNLTRPDSKDYPTGEAFDEALKEYEELYADKQRRDNIRKYFEDHPIKLSVYSLYVYKNGQTSRIDETITSITDHCADGSVVYVKGSSNFEKIDINNYDYGDELEKDIANKFARSGMLCIYRADNTKVTVTDEKTPYVFEDAVVSGDYVYFIVKKSVLYCYDLTNGNASEISSNVSELVTTDNEDVLYAIYNNKTSGAATSTIYRVTKNEMQLIVDDAANYSIIDDSNVAYVKCEQGNNHGTLYLNTNKKHKELDTDVYAYRIVARGTESILYFKNYAEQSGHTPTADLYWYKDDGSPTKADYNVSSIIF